MPSLDTDVKEFINDRRRVYTPTEVSYHNCVGDCWVSVFHKVYDLTIFLEDHKGPLAQPIIEHAGQDLSHWFDKDTMHIKLSINPETGINSPYLPYGRFVHAPPTHPVGNWRNDFGTPWWKNEELCIGDLSQKTRKIRIVNTLSTQEKILEVCSEETMAEILDRYLNYNKHANSYTWKALKHGDFRPLDMNKTLEQNDVFDESDEFEKLSVDDDAYYALVYLYFNDDLTVA